MKKALSLSIVFFFLLLCCKNSEKRESNLRIDSIDSLGENSSTSDHEENYLIRDSLVIAWEQKLLDFTKNSNFKSEKTTMENIYDQSITDTLITFSQNNSKIEVYKAQNFEAVKSAYIESPDFLLDEFLHVGSKKLVLEAAVEQGLSEEPIKVGNEEETSVFTFTFEDVRIHSITFEGYVD